MKSPSVSSRLLSLLLAIMLFSISASMAWAAANDFAARRVVSSGVKIAGRDLSGLDEGEARDVIGQAVTAPLLAPISISVDGSLHSFDPRGTVSVDVAAMLEQALSARQSASYLTRIAHDLAGQDLPLQVEPRYVIDEDALDAWIANLKRNVDLAAVDASVTVDDGRIRVIASRRGRQINSDDAREALQNVFRSRTDADSDSAVVLPVERLDPKVTEEKLGKTIIVDLSERRIHLYDGATEIKTYRCAVGTPGYPTPQGRFRIVQKRYRPTWSNPGSGWAKDMPKSIPPGPGNPLGTRALNLDASGIRLHGTNKIGSIGTAASHGCMRMLRHDIEDLYDRVEVGAPVFIIP